MRLYSFVQFYFSLLPSLLPFPFLSFFTSFYFSISSRFLEYFDSHGQYSTANCTSDSEVQLSIGNINMDVYESDKLPLPQPFYYRHPAAGTAGAADATARVMPSELPSMTWKIPSITRQHHQQHHQQHPPPFIAPFPITTSGYHAPGAFAGRSVFTPSANPTVQINPAFSLAGDSASSSNGRSNGTATTSNIPSMMPTVAGTTAGHHSPSLPLPHVAATVRQASAGVMAASVSAMGIAAVNATHQQQVHQEPNTQLPKLNGLSHHCPMCDKSFKRKSWLRRHLLSHSPERHFGCPWCLSKHKRKDNLLQHMKLKHTEFVLEKLRNHNVGIDGEVRNDNIRTLLYEGRLNKEDVKKVLNGLIDSYNG